jgi:hypothetical protein
MKIDGAVKSPLGFISALFTQPSVNETVDRFDQDWCERPTAAGVKWFSLFPGSPR